MVWSKDMNIIAKRKIWYAISLIVIIPGLISLLMPPHLKLGIDFRGGSEMELDGRVEAEKVTSTTSKLGLKDVTVTQVGENGTLIRFRDDSEPAKKEANRLSLKSTLEEQDAKQVRFDNVGPSVSADITRNALLSLLVVSLAIVAYIAYAFRNMPPPLKGYEFGVIAIITLLHDALLLVGIFSLLGRFAHVEVDALFVTAVLTVIGFSVHDTIVVFDRVRENLRRENKPFETIVNDSILETFARSINTSVTVLLTLLALLLFGGSSIRYFVLALLIGIASGTYSSIFNASPLLVTWYLRKTKS